MKDCNGCRWADWKRTEKGRLHPSGDGRCTKTITLPKLPACKHWLSLGTTCGGHINRRIELKEHCVYWERG